MGTEPQRTCPSCGNELSGVMEFCPVCMLRKALAGGVEFGEFSFEEAVKPTLEKAVQRFEHYELVTGEDGKPQSMRHIGDKKRVPSEDVDSAYLFGNAQSANCLSASRFGFARRRK